MRLLAGFLALLLSASAALADSRAFNGTTDFLRGSNAAMFTGTNYPITICAWVEPTSFAANSTIASFSSSTTADRIGLRITAGGKVSAQSFSGATGNGGTNPTLVMTVNTWHLACAKFGAVNQRTGYLDNDKGADTGTRTIVAALDRFSIGVQDINVPAEFCLCNIAALAVWNVVIPDTDIDKMVNGAPFWRFSPHGLLFYAPHFSLGGGGVLDWRSGLSMSGSGTSVTADTPPIQQP